jgi:hypothetical protein
VKGFEMAEETIISWNVTNWITVILMAAVGFALLGFAGKLIQKRKAANAGA